MVGVWIVVSMVEDIRRGLVYIGLGDAKF